MQTLTKENLSALKGGANFSQQIKIGGNTYNVQLDTTQKQICVVAVPPPPSNPFQAPPRPIAYCFKY